MTRRRTVALSIAAAVTFAQPAAQAEVMAADWTPLVVALVVVPDSIFATYDILHPREGSDQGRSPSRTS